MGRLTPSHRVVAALGAATATVVLARLWGLSLVAGGAELKLAAVPWFGRWETSMRLSTVVWPVAFAVVVVAVGPTLASQLRMGPLVFLTGVASGVWAVLLYLLDRPISEIGAPLESRFDYLAAVPEVGSLGPFLRGFVDQIATYPIHVQGHPPGMVVLLWLLDRIGLDGATPAAIVVLAVAASAPVAVLLTAREVLPEAVVRRAAPFLVLVPAALWVATTADGLFMGVGAWAILLVVVATRRHGRRSDVLAVAGGALFAVGLHLTYGLAPLGAIPAWIILSRRSWRTAIGGAIGGVVVIVASSTAGFFLLDGLQATADRYEAGVSSSRPYSYFVIANLAVLLVSIGPAPVAALATMRRDIRVGLVWSAVVAVLAADVSGLSKGEVERIWLPYVPWIVLAAGCTTIPAVVTVGVRRVDRDRVLLAAQATVGILLAVFLRSPW